MLPKYFDSVIGTDPSKNMIEQAKQLSRESNDSPKLHYLVCSAETVSSEVEAESVDLVTAGT